MLPFCHWKSQGFSERDLHPMFCPGAIIIPHMHFFFNDRKYRLIIFHAFDQTLIYCSYLPVLYFLINHFHSFSLFVTFTWLKLGYWLELWGKERFPIHWYSTWTLLFHSDTQKTYAILWELLTNIINILCCQCNLLRSSQNTDNLDEIEINISSSPSPSINHKTSWLEIWGQSYFF